MDHRGVSDGVMAGRLGVTRETVWKRYTDQKRLDPGKIAEFADALDMDARELLYPPGTKSLDAMVEGADAATRQMAADIVQRMMNKAS